MERLLGPPANSCEAAAPGDTSRSLPGLERDWPVDSVSSSSLGSTPDEPHDASLKHNLGRKIRSNRVVFQVRRQIYRRQQLSQRGQQFKTHGANLREVRGLV